MGIQPGFPSNVAGDHTDRVELVKRVLLQWHKDDEAVMRDALRLVNDAVFGLPAQLPLPVAVPGMPPAAPLVPPQAPARLPLPAAPVQRPAPAAHYGSGSNVIRAVAPRGPQPVAPPVPVPAKPPPAGVAVHPHYANMMRDSAVREKVVGGARKRSLAQVLDAQSSEDDSDVPLARVIQARPGLQYATVGAAARATQAGAASRPPGPTSRFQDMGMPGVAPASHGGVVTALNGLARPGGVAAAAGAAQRARAAAGPPPPRDPRLAAAAAAAAASGGVGGGDVDTDDAVARNPKAKAKALAVMQYMMQQKQQSQASSGSSQGAVGRQPQPQQHLASAQSTLRAQQQQQQLSAAAAQAAALQRVAARAAANANANAGPAIYHANNPTSHGIQKTVMFRQQQQPAHTIRVGNQTVPINTGIRTNTAVKQTVHQIGGVNPAAEAARLSAQAQVLAQRAVVGAGLQGAQQVRAAALAGRAAGSPQLQRAGSGQHMGVVWTPGAKPAGGPQNQAMYANAQQGAPAQQGVRIVRQTLQGPQR